MKQLSHLDANGRARMIDVSPKVATHRQATVQCLVHLSSEAFDAIQRHTLKKGDAFTVAKIAGIQAAKRTSELIPLCHLLPLEHLELSFEPQASTQTIHVAAQATTTAKTGIELEAFVAAAVAALTLYDMVKAVDPAATITDLQLLTKTGGRQPFRRRTSPCAQPS